MQGQLEEALELLGIYWSCHGLHMGFEDEILLPKYRELDSPGRWDATLYSKEHQKIDDLFLRIKNTLTSLIEQRLEASQLRRGIIQLLDREKSFKGLCEHHQEREEKSLFPELDRQAESSWIQENGRQFAASWEKGFAPSLESARLCSMKLLSPARTPQGQV